jgi:mono/diheme cytochrome c family protein
VSTSQDFNDIESGPSFSATAARCLQWASIVAIGMFTTACDRRAPPQAVEAEPAVPEEQPALEEQPAAVEQTVAAEQEVAVEQAVPAEADSQPEELTIWDGVYTEEQRRRGEAVYAASCERCHGADLVAEEDEIVPPLVGEEFLKGWQRKRVGNLFEFLRKEMPSDEEERLSRPEYAAVLAYLLSMNRAPAGTKALAENFADLQAIRMAKTE